VKDQQPTSIGHSPIGAHAGRLILGSRHRGARSGGIALGGDIGRRGLGKQRRIGQHTIIRRGGGAGEQTRRLPGHSRPLRVRRRQVGGGGGGAGLGLRGGDERRHGAEELEIVRAHGAHGRGGGRPAPVPTPRPCPAKVTHTCDIRLSFTARSNMLEGAGLTVQE
jgi:hypothetical protein